MKVKVSFGIYKIMGCRKKNVRVQEETTKSTRGRLP